MRILNETFVAYNISVKKVDQVISNINANNVIAFTDDEIPLKGHESTKALNITISCKRYTLSRTLIANRSPVNVILIATLARLAVDLSYMRKTHLVVRAFDGTYK